MTKDFVMSEKFQILAVDDEPFNLTEIHNGEIKVQSELDKGSCFYISL